MVHAGCRGCVDAHGSCDCPWAGLSPEVMLMCIIWGSMMISEVHASTGENVGVCVLYIVCTATGDSVEVCGSCCCQKPLGRP